MDFSKTAQEILSAIGGKENLVSAAHCATRLRLVIADNSKIQITVLENVEGVKGVFEAAGQLQIIIGTGTVNKVYESFIAQAGIDGTTKEEVKAMAAEQSPWYKRAIKTLGDIFVPIIPAIVATGLLNGLLGGLVQVFPQMADSYLYELLAIFSNAALTFLPILIAVSAVKIFGGNIWMPIATAANVAQGAAALAVALKTKKSTTKAMALPASLSAFMGITEPAIFGVNIRYMRPFVAGMIGGACGSAVASIMQVYATANGVTGLFGLLITTDSFLGYLLTMVVAFGVAFTASWLLGIREEEKDSNHTDNIPEAEELKQTGGKEIAAPLTGQVRALKEVPDATFAEGILGEGIAIEPEEGLVTAPGDGIVSALFDTHHAIGLTLDNGAEVLIHVGINTVELNGACFEAHVLEGNRVCKGQKLITFDKDKIVEKGYSIITPVIISNTDDYAAIVCKAEDRVCKTDLLFTLEEA